MTTVTSDDIVVDRQDAARLLGGREALRHACPRGLAEPPRQVGVVEDAPQRRRERLEEGRHVLAEPELDPLAHAEPLRLALERVLERAALLEVATGEHEPRARYLRERVQQLALALHVAETGDLADPRRLVAAVLVVRRELDAVVDDLDPPARVALALVGALRVLRDGDEARGEPSRRVVESCEEPIDRE